MLTISNVANSAKAGSYYETADDYYSKDRSPSQWSGKAAAELGLHGAVQAEDFRAMLDGRLPNGVQLHHAGEGSGRRGGTDLTLSAPKSVSIQALIGGDTRLLAAHEAAVARTLEHAEALAACRVTVDGVTTRQQTGTLAIAQFRHDLSRAADPQLHTHAVAVNVTQRADGQWRALNNDLFYSNKMWLGAYYRSELAQEVRALGYEVRLTDGGKTFELAHITGEQIKEFSTRANEMEKRLLQEKGLTREQASARQLQAAALQTRDAKQTHDRAQLLGQWRERAAGVGLDWTARGAAPIERDASREAVAAAKSVEYAAAHLMERESVMNHREIEQVALERGVGRTDLPAIRQAIEQAVQRGEFIRQDDRYTTPAAQERERQVLAMEAAGRGQVAALMKPEAVQLALLGSRLNEDQRGVVVHVLTGTDRVSGVQGSAGTGKTTALRAVREMAEASGMTLVGAAPSAGAARELAGSGIQSQTIASLATKNHNGLDARTLLVVDEAGMVSTRDMHGLLTAAERAGSRVLLVGDVRQLKAVQAGKPFAQLQQAGMNGARLEQIQRQQDPQLKAAVELAAAGDVAGSLKRLWGNVVEIGPQSERHARIASEYAALTPGQRASTLIVANTNHSRELINREVRQAIGLAGQGHAVHTLGDKNLSKAQAARTVSYEVGDVVRADRNYESLGMGRGEFASVVEGRAGVVTLERGDGQRVEWRPVNHPHMSVFTERERELAPGDVVRFTSNDHRAGFINGERATVVAIDPAQGRLTLDKADGTRLEQRLDTPLYLEHGYCRTVYSTQGQTADRVMIEALASDKMGNEASHYVSISRAAQHVAIYTDDAQRLPEALGREDGKSAALEVGAQKSERQVEGMGMG